MKHMVKWLFFAATAAGFIVRYRNRKRKEEHI